VSSEAFENCKNWMLELHRLFVAGTEDDLAPDGSDGPGDILREKLGDVWWTQSLAAEKGDAQAEAELFAIDRFSEDLFQVQRCPGRYTEAWALKRLERNRAKLAKEKER